VPCAGGNSAVCGYHCDASSYVALAEEFKPKNKQLEQRQYSPLGSTEI
jgi:hypothetical protein